MGGGLMQLVAYGAQDIYLTGNPQITFFKVVYRRHTNFSMECIEQTFNGTKAFGSNVTATISRNGDLVSGLYVTFNPRLVCGTIAKKLSVLETAHNIGFGLIEQVDIEIGGQRIDRQFGKWMNVWSDLTRKNYSNNKGGLVYPGEIVEGPTRNQTAASDQATPGTTSDAGCVYQNPVNRGYLETNHQGVQGRAQLSTDGASAHSTLASNNPGDGVSDGDANVIATGSVDTASSDGDVQGYGVPTQFQRTSFNIGSSRVVTAAGDLGTAVGVDVGYASVPLDFWFCRNPGLALPLIALQYHEVKINLTITARDKLVNVGRQADGAEVLHGANNVTTKPPAGEFASGGSPDAGSISLWADYIYLDTDERRRFAQVSHEYLIEQVQYISNPPSSSKTINLNFNHPVKELIWCGAPNDTPLSNTLNIDAKFSGTNTGVPDANGLLMDTGSGRVGSTPGSGGETVITLTEGTHQFNSDLQTYRPDGVKIQCGPSVPTPLAVDEQSTLLSENDDSFKWTIKLNGHERFAPRHPRYFTDTQIANHHTGSSGIFHEGSISVYSFALKPEEHQPSGTCNFSRIDNAQLVLSGNATKLCSVLPTKGMDIYAVNYNVLRIMSGMGGLAYSN